MSTGGWSPGAAELYQALVRARLVEAHCHRCGSSLESALPQVRTSVGLLLNEFQLGDFAAARLLAHTDELVVECQDCGARNEVQALGEQPPVPESGTHRSKSTSSPAAGPTHGSRPASTGGWPSEAVDLYHTLVRAWLRRQKCHSCGASLESPSDFFGKTWAVTLFNEFRLRDVGVARRLATKDDLVVECNHCGTSNEVPPPDERPPTEPQPAPVDGLVTGAKAPPPVEPPPAGVQSAAANRAFFMQVSLSWLRRLARACLGVVERAFRRRSGR